MIMTLKNWKSLHLAAFAFCSFALGGHAIADVLNGGFVTATSNLADNWNTLGGSVRGGSQGGYGWTTSYFGGAYPTNDTFCSTMAGPVRQDLAGSDSTFVEGTTYTIQAALFSASNYTSSNTAKIMWSVALTANGTAVARDQWFSDEFSGQTVANGGNIPNDHILQVTSTSTGLKMVTIAYTATAADAGKVIGVQLGGDTALKYTLGAGAPVPDDYFGMMDSITVSASSAAILTQFSSDKTVIDNNPVTLSWTVANPASMASLSLSDGSGSVDVIPNTNATTGVGSITFSPAATTTYTLTLNGTSSLQCSVSGGTIGSFTSGRGLSLLKDGNQVVLSWQVQPMAPASLTLSDGSSTFDVTSLTNPATGVGTGLFAVPSTTTNFTLNLNYGSSTKSLRVQREAANSGAFTLDKVKYAVGETTIATWSGVTGNPDSWVGIYTASSQVVVQYSTQWNYLNGTKTTGGNIPSGSMGFTLPEGEYYAVLFLDGGYTVEKGAIFFRVTNPANEVPETFKMVSSSLSEGNFNLTWESKAGYVYRIYTSPTLAGNPEQDWQLLENAWPSQGDGTTSYADVLPIPAPEKRFYKIFGAAP